jgi:indolepyruvate ferredoxin oxidoreductase beta subunit
MKYDVVLAGVGGQGVMSVAAIISQAAVEEGLEVRQSEVHGMAQRGGAVLAHLRIADKPIASDLVPRGAADMILGTEPLEGLRYANWLSPNGIFVTAADPMANIPNYPEISSVIEAIEGFPSYRIINALPLAKDAGLSRSVNMVMVGAASTFLPISVKALEKMIERMFISKDESAVEANKKAFNFGRNAAK